MPKYGFFLLIFLIPLPLSGQLLNWDLNTSGNSNGINRDRRIIVDKTDSLMKYYHDHIAFPKDFINGREYVPYFYRSETTPLLFSGEEMISTLIFDGRRYENISLLYDTYLDELIYIDTTRMVNFQYPRIILNKDLVDAATFFYNGEKMEFRHLRFRKDPGENLKDGFYEVVSAGSEKFIIRHRSAEYTRDAMNEYHYLPEKYFFIDGKYHNIKTMKDLLLLFGEKSKEMKDYIKSSGIKIHKANKWQMAEVLRQYEALEGTEEVSK